MCSLNSAWYFGLTKARQPVFAWLGSGRAWAVPYSLAAGACKHIRSRLRGGWPPFRVGEGSRAGGEARGKSSSGSSACLQALLICGHVRTQGAGMVMQ